MIAGRITNGARCEVLTRVVFIISLALKKRTIAACIICLLTTSKHTHTRRAHTYYTLYYTHIRIIILLLSWFQHTHRYLNTQHTFIYVGAMIKYMFYTRAPIKTDGQCYFSLSRAHITYYIYRTGARVSQKSI